MEPQVSPAPFRTDATGAALPAPAAAEPRDLGFGAKVASESRQRLLNRDGTFNVEREGLTPFASLSLYHFLLTVSWPRFLAFVSAGFLLVNALFAAAYTALGPGALGGVTATSVGERFVKGFFFSIQTLATIGYGAVHPASMAANLVVTIEVLVGLMGLALATGLVFARFSRPTAKILFSDSALIAPYHGGTAFMFRIVNGRSNQLIEVTAQVSLSRRRAGRREFDQLPLERDRVTFFPLSWTVVHPITPESPLWGMTEEELLAADAEFFILLKGLDETFSQEVHARSSYKAEELVWGARFVNVFHLDREDGRLGIDITRISEIEREAVEAES